MAQDPLDTGAPAAKAWEEYRARHAAALLLHFLFKDLEAVYPDYTGDLWLRLQMVFDYKELLEAQGLYDGALPMHGPDGSTDIDYWIDESALHEVHDELFPHGPEATAPQETDRKLVLIGLHNAFECYLHALGLDTRKGLPASATRALSEHGFKLDADTYNDLVDFDATRNILVHNGGVVDERYVYAQCTDAS